MPNAAQIVLTVGSETLTFTPDSVTGTHVLFQNAAQGALNKRELLHFDRAVGSKTIRRTQRVNVPLVRTVDGAEVMKMGTVKIEYVLPDDSTQAERERLIGIVKALAGDATASSVVAVPEWFY